MSNKWYKDPDDTLNFKFDYAPLENGNGNSNWLDRTSSPLEIISEKSLSIDSPGPTIESSTITDSSTSVMISVSGGTAGHQYKVVCTITTSTGQVLERTAYIHVHDM
jgi:hypothetical protein